MMKNGKSRLLMLSGLSAIAIVLSLLFLLFAGNIPSSIWLLIATVLGLSIAAVVISYSKLKESTQRIKHLPKDYQETLLSAEEYIGLTSLGRLEKRNIYFMIVEIFEHAALDHRDVNDVINHDLAAYLQPFLESSGSKTGFLYWLGYSSSLFVSYLLLMKVYKVLRPGNFTLDLLKTETLDLGITLSYALIAFIFFPWLMLTLQASTKHQWKGVKRLLILLPLIIPFGLLIMLIAIDTPALRSFLDYPTPIFTSPFSMALGLLVLAGSLILIRLNHILAIRKIK